MKGLYGDNALLQGFLDQFKKKLIESTSKIPGVTVTGGGNYNTVGVLTQGVEDSHETDMNSFRGNNFQIES